MIIAVGVIEKEELGDVLEEQLVNQNQLKVSTNQQPYLSSL